MPITNLPNPGMDFTPLTPLTAEEMDDLVENIEAVNAAPGLNYSTSEVDTGMTWIDGKHIYKKTVDFGAEPAANQAKKVSANISNLDKVIKIEAMGIDDNHAGLPLPYPVNASNASYELCYYGGDIEITRGSISVNMTQIYVTLYYTKTS